MSVIADVANAVVGELNDAELSQALAAELAYRPAYDLKALQSLKVIVVPRAVNIERATRSSHSRMVQVDVGIMRKVSNDSDIGTLLDLVEEVVGCFAVGRRTGGYLCVEIDNDPVYAPEHIEQYRQFTSVVTLTFEVIQ